jgi:3-oxoacyl-[acyl-carrier protein] reductase
MDLGLNGKTALVLGSGSGLGAAIAVALAREGARVALAGRHIATVQAVADNITASGGAALALQWDISELAVIDANVGAIEEKFGPVDILINNTGGPPPTSAAGQDTALWQAQFQSMVLSVIAITDRVLPAMRTRGWGRIITSTSAGVVAPLPNLAISNALRAALTGWSKTLAREVGPDGVTANIVLPGRISTKRIQFLDQQKAKRDGEDVTKVEADSTASIPLGRYGDPAEYADVVAFIASARASYITGTIIRVDGGMIQSV